MGYVQCPELLGNLVTEITAKMYLEKDKNCYLSTDTIDVVENNGPLINNSFSLPQDVSSR